MRKKIEGISKKTKLFKEDKNLANKIRLEKGLNTSRGNHNNNPSVENFNEVGNIFFQNN